jgi:hypothetical protein
MRAPIAIERLLPSHCKDPDWSRVLYPNPPSHDSITWLVIAEMMRRYHDAPPPLTVRFLLCDNRLGAVDFSHYSVAAGKAYQCGVDRAYSDQMIPNVLLPGIQMIGAMRELPDLHLETCTPEDLAGYVEYDYHIGHLVDAARQGHEVPRFSTVPWAEREVDEFLGGQRPVVITLRETTLQPERNSRLFQWLRFAASIEKDFPVLFVRDTAQAEQPLGPFTTWPRASHNAYIRAALYRRAFCNLMVCTGPVNWCNFTDAPVLIFKQLVPALPHWQGGQPEGWREQCHLEVGEQLPWALPTQRLTWTDDTFINIRAAFDEFLKAKVATAA